MVTIPRYTGERAVPWNRGTGAILIPHVARYAWALRFVASQRVVDLGCGTGYGSMILSWMARGGRGGDIDPEAIEFAFMSFRGPNLSFMQADLAHEPPPPANLYVAFEFLEHLQDPRALLAKLHGPLVWSLPVDDGSKFHARPYSAGEIEAMMGGEIYYQSDEGLIVEKEIAWFEPAYILGVRPCAS